jgi:hypothetical protein
MNHIIERKRHIDDKSLKYYNYEPCTVNFPLSNMYGRMGTDGYMNLLVA